MRLFSPVLSLALSLLCAIPAFAVPQRAIPAKAAVVMDSAGTVLYSKFPDARLAPASTVELITAMVVIDNLDPEYTVTVSKHAGKARSIQPRLHAGEELRIIDLLHLALMKSVNSSAVALAEAVAGTEDDFVPLMNSKARELGAHNTLFANASGLPKGSQYTTAGDLALIMRAAMSYPLIREILAKKGTILRTAEGRYIVIDNTNDLLWLNDSIIGGKTGYTGNARHCFVCAVNTEKGPLYTAVLGARSRTNLWRSTLLLTEIGKNPELAQPRSRSRASQNR